MFDINDVLSYVEILTKINKCHKYCSMLVHDS